MSLVQTDLTAGPAWFAVDLKTGLTLYEDNADVRMAPASTAKLVTAIAAMRVLSVNAQVSVEESDLVPEEYSKMGVEPGDVLTVEQLLYGALVPSGGDAARALARAAGLALDPASQDPVERFVEEMNVVAAGIGMSDSSFGNPEGRDDERSWTTARDLVMAGRIVLADPLLSVIVRTPWAGMMISGPAPREIVIENTNQFVLFDDAIGVKTGTTDAAGQNLISAFRFGDNTVVTVVLGSTDRYAETSAMLDLVREDWVWLELGRDAASLGAADELAAQGLWMPVGRTIVLNSSMLADASYELQLSSGAGILSEGAVVFKVGGTVAAELPVYRSNQPSGD